MSRSPTFDDFIAGEARGDASNFKGTDYHLLYSIWLMLTKQVRSVHFFEGNDVLAKPCVPTKCNSEDTSAALVACSNDDTDEWIQLKCTAAVWTRSELLDGHLLVNFICNSYLSDSRKRAWRVRLATTAEIQSPEIIEFVENPTAFPSLEKKARAIVESAFATLSNTLGSGPTKELIFDRLLAVLRAMAECRPISRREIYAESLAELAYLFTDRQIAYQALNQLVGRMLQDAGSNGQEPRVYDQEWLASTTGRGAAASLPFDESAASGCDAQVRARFPIGFTRERLVQRQAGLRQIDDFVKSPDSIFILSGRSGTGKSWLVTDWAHSTAHGRARLLVPGRMVIPGTSLIQLIAGEMRSLTSSVNDDLTLFHRIVKPAGFPTFGPLVLVLDDVRADFSRRSEFVAQLSQLVEDGQKYGIKFLITCQSDVLKSIGPYLHRTFGVFSPERERTSGVDSGSYSLEEFTDDELGAYVGMRAEGDNAERILHRLRDPRFLEFHNPYALDLVFDELMQDPRAPIIDVPATLFAKCYRERIERQSAAAAVLCGYGANDVSLIVKEIAAVLWTRRSETVTYLQLCHAITSHFSQASQPVLEALRSDGLIDVSIAIQFSDAKIAARLFAEHLLENTSSFPEMIAQLRIERDHDIVVQMCALSDDPCSLVTAISKADRQWSPALAEGLERCDPNDRRIIATLLALSRHEDGNWPVIDSFGRFAIRSKTGRKELLRLFLSHHEDERYFAERALWHIGPFVPEFLARAMRLRFRLTRRSPKDDKKRISWRRQLARALSVAARIDSRYAASCISPILELIEQTIAEELKREIPDRRLDFALRDKLLGEFDQISALVAAYVDAAEWARFIADLKSTEVVVRTRAVNALELVGRVLHARIQSEMCAAIASELNPTLLARVLWNSFRLAKSTSTQVLAAIATNLGVCVSSYESLAATLGLLEVLAESRPTEVRVLLASLTNELSEEERLLVSEIELVCAIRCSQMLRDDKLQHVTQWNEDDVRAFAPANRLIALRFNAAVDVLRAGVEIGLVGLPDIWRMELRDCGPDHFMLDLSKWFRISSQGALSHTTSTLLIKCLIDVVREANEVQPDVRDKWRKNLRFQLARDCLDLLCEILVFESAPELFIRQVPDDWERLYIARELLERGVRRPELIKCALEECERRAKSATAQASHERGACLSILQKVAPEG
ncbi:MAG: hypothetical protein C0483_23705, partial [Pirellula sp.]|nr:hypothetical protein [Pirellula sp.]